MNKSFIYQGFFFVIIQLLAVFTALRIRELQAKGVVDVDINQIQVPPDMEPWRFLVIFLVIIVFTVFAIKFRKGGGIVLKLLFTIAALWGGGLVLSLYFGSIAALVLMGAFILLWLWHGTVILQNILVSLSIAGISGAIGLRFVPESIAILMIIFSIYDVVAVYATKHMLKLIKVMTDSGAPMAIIAPDKLSKFFVPVKNIEPSKGFMMLGSGDIAFPAMLASSVSASSVQEALLVVLFSLIGLSLTLILFNALKKKPMAALPPIAIMSILGFVLTKVL